MTNKKKILIIFLLITTLLLVGCGFEKENASDKSVTSATETATLRIEVDELLYEEFGDLRSVYNYEPFYAADEWMDDKGELLFPYESNKDMMKGIENILASLHMPEGVLKEASTEELLRVICEGWLSTHATSPLLFNLPSEYVANSMARNQATNEFMRRSDMLNVLVEDYLQRCYIHDDEYSDEATFALNQIQFEEIILASNYVYAQMDDSMKEKVINAVLEKVSYMESGKYYTGDLASGFFTYIIEAQNNGGSYWYTYICENEIETARKYINLENVVSWIKCE